MLKAAEALKLEHDAVGAFQALIASIPIAELKITQFEQDRPDIGADAVIDVQVVDKLYRLFCEVKSDGHPAAARRAIYQFKHWPHRTDKTATVFIAPYISEQARALCVEAGVNYFDLFGNFRLSLDNLFVERTVADKPATERRDLKSLYKPKSARVLRWLLRESQRPARLQEIADGAKVSLGQVHNVKEGLLAREWAKTTSDGLILSDPSALLDAWREDYEAPAGQTRNYYTILHGETLMAKLRAIMADEVAPNLALGSYSAANWLAPYGRAETTFIYVLPDVMPRLESELSLEPAAKGANIVIKLLEEEGVLLDAIQPVEGVVTTSPVQTYLDLFSSGDRGREAADFLRQRGLEWRRA